MSYHAKLSPSSAHRWTSCTASINAQEGIPNKNSAASMEGTCCHQMSAEHLEDGVPLQDYLGRKMIFVEWIDYTGESHTGEDWESHFVDNDLRGKTITGEVVVTQDMVDAVATATDYIKQRQADTGGLLEVEQRVPIGHFTGEADATGTADVVLIYGSTIECIDFKYGRHKVHAHSGGRMNPQLAHYVLGAIEKFGLLFDFTECRATILQPFIGHVSEYACGIAELMAQQEFFRIKAEETRTNPQFKPSGENCHFCRASGKCDAQRDLVLGTALDMFDQPAPVAATRALGTLYDLVPLVKVWANDVAALVRSELDAGRPVLRDDGLHYKLVDGQRGDRYWDEPERVAEYLKAIRLKTEDVYTMKLKSPAQVEAMSKKKRDKAAPPPLVGPTQWTRLQDHIKQEPGSPTIALSTDPRPAIDKTAGFDEVPL